MFNEVLGMLSKNRSEFNEKVRDEFGRSIDENTYNEVVSLANQLQNDYNEAEDQMAQVDRMLSEARAMV